MASKPLFPRKTDEFHNWVNNFIVKIKEPAMQAVVGLPDLALEILLQQFDLYEESYKTYVVEKMKNPAMSAQYHSRLDTLQANIRNIYNRYIRFNTDVDNEMRRDMDLPIPDDTKSPIVMPTTAPYITLQILSNQRVKFKVMSDVEHRAKPVGANGVEIRAFNGAEPPEDPDEFIEILKSTKGSFEMQYNFSSIGQVVWYIGRWYGTRGQQSAWSAPVSAAVN
ncbi:MAG: hypothetical protein LBL74_08735 [Bacteroidales bacterium]|jgi:hypothetical protein|nr:hypothetical protein [Bacteroidales bacterium]